MPNHIPIRTCVGCGRKRPKAELLRVCRTPDRRVELDPEGRREGRGAYLCPERSCVLQASKKNGLARTLRTSVAAEVYERIAAFINGG